MNEEDLLKGISDDWLEEKVISYIKNHSPCSRDELENHIINEIERRKAGDILPWEEVE